MLKPPTSSPSASARSNGARLVSPTIDDAVDDERHRQQPDVPAGLLLGDDRRGGQRAGVQEHRDERQAHRDVVGDHLRRRAQPAEQRVGRSGRPAAEHDAVDADRGERQRDQHADRRVDQLQRGLLAEHGHLAADRDDREDQERRDGRERRRQDVDDLVRPGRDDALLEDAASARRPATAAGRTGRSSSGRAGAASGRRPCVRTRSRTASAAAG